MCFGDRKQRTSTPPPRPLERKPATPARHGPPTKLTKPRPQAVPPPPVSERSSMDITWPLDRPVDDSPPRIISPYPPSSSVSTQDEIRAPRPFRYDDGSIPPSNVPSLYTLSDSSPSTPTEESLFDFHAPPTEWPPSPPPVCPPTPSSMCESLRVASLMPAPLVSVPRVTPQRMRRAPTPPLPRINIPAPPVPALPIDLPSNISPAFRNPSPRSAKGFPPIKAPSHIKSPLPVRAPSPIKFPSPAKSPPRSPVKAPKAPARPITPNLNVRRSSPLPALQRAKTMTSAMRPKFTLPETLAPFSLATPPMVLDLYEPPQPPMSVRIPPAVPQRTAPLEKVQSPGRIAVSAEEVLEPSSREAASVSSEISYEKIRLFPIPDSIINGERRYQEKKRREEASRRSNSNCNSNDGSRSSQDSSSGYDSRCPSPVGELRPASFALGHLSSRFSMSSLGSTLRVHDPHMGYDLQRPASARPRVGGSAGGSGGGGSIPTFPSRHEAKKARKLWLAEQEEAKRQSAKMGVEGILGWDATTRRWVNKMTDEEKAAWLNQWKEKRSAQQALQRANSCRKPASSMEWKCRPLAV